MPCVVSFVAYDFVQWAYSVPDENDRREARELARCRVKPGIPQEVPDWVMTDELFLIGMEAGKIKLINSGA